MGPSLSLPTPVVDVLCDFARVVRATNPADPHALVALSDAADACVEVLGRMPTITSRDVDRLLQDHTLPQPLRVATLRVLLAAADVDAARLGTLLQRAGRDAEALVLVSAHPRADASVWHAVLAQGGDGRVLSALAAHPRAARDRIVCDTLFAHRRRAGLPYHAALLAGADAARYRLLFGELLAVSPARATECLLAATPEQRGALMAEDLTPLLTAPHEDQRLAGFAALEHVSVDPVAHPQDDTSTHGIPARPSSLGTS
jgi:hypothetical protein